MEQHKLIVMKESDQAFEQLKSDVDRIITSFQKRLINSVTNVVSHAVQYARQTPQEAPQGTRQQSMQVGQPKSLPWFKYGIRGFLNKLWYGDSPSNPNYQTEGMTLKSYIRLEEEINGAADIIIGEILCEVGAETDDLQSGWMDVFKDFRNELFSTIQKHLSRRNVVTPQAQPQTTEIPEVPEAPKNPRDIPPTDDELSKSIEWWKHIGKQHFDNEETTKIMKFLDRRKSHDNYRRIFSNKRDRAERIMQDADLDPNNPEDVKLIWPWHLHVPIRGTKMEKSAGPIESEDHKAAMRILEGAKPSTMANYYKILLESRR